MSVDFNFGSAQTKIENYPALSPTPRTSTSYREDLFCIYLFVVLALMTTKILEIHHWH